MTPGAHIMAKEDADPMVADLLDIADYPDAWDAETRTLTFSEPNNDLIDVAMCGALGTKIAAAWITFLRSGGYALCFLQLWEPRGEPTYIALDSDDDLDLLVEIAKHGALTIHVATLAPQRITCDTKGLRFTLARRAELLGVAA